jgi:FlaA1/EpsC-like NDP-sugar epimerase
MTFLSNFINKDGQDNYLPRQIVLGIDLLLTAVAFSISYWLYFSLKEMEVFFIAFGVKLLMCLSVNLFFFIVFNTFQGIVRYSTLRDSMTIFLALSAANISLVIINYLSTIYIGHTIFAWEYFFINFFLAFSLMFMLRMAVKTFYDYVNSGRNETRHTIPLLIYGDGPAQVGIAQLLTASGSLPYRVAGFISSSPNTFTDKKILGLPVFDKNKTLNKLLPSGNIGAVLLDPYGLDVADKKELSDICFGLKIRLLNMPQPENMSGAEIRELQKFNIEDLLGRASIETDTVAIKRDLAGKTVMITGAAGSIGSEIVRQLSRFGTKMLLLVDTAESPLHTLTLEMKDYHGDAAFTAVIADVRDRERMRRLFEQHRPDYVFHAAAYKHVPMMEENPCEAVLTNIMGTRNIADLAAANGVACFVMISTDKAVNPCNIMGASKRIAEIYVQSLTGSTRFITTRFGNVLGSNGSVIPRFDEQIRRGGPVTVTHPDVLRYFMTIREACSLVLEAATLGRGGEVFVFDMGEPVKIIDLAKKMIQLSGFEPYKDIDIEITGLRKGEKLFEELLYDRENVTETANRKIKIGHVRRYEPDEVRPAVDAIIAAAAQGDSEQAIALMKQLAPEFQHSLFN